jgi:hypothetical protein
MSNKQTKSERFIKELFINEEDNSYVTEVELQISNHDIAEMGFEKSYEDVNAVLTKKVNIKWVGELEYRSWGIKSFIAVIPEGQGFSVIYEKIIDEEGNVKEIEKEIKLGKISIVEDNNFSFPICPKELTWDKRSGWKLEF